MSLATGARLGPYEIIAPLGSGGMGEVYRARDVRLNRTVAIKVLPDGLAADPQFRDRFEREARTISQLTHPNICTLHDVGDVEGAAFLVMEFLEGETLASRLEKSRLKVDDAFRIAIEIASALDAAHRAGVIHRDLKPANVMLTKGGAKLLDFGLAKAGVSGLPGAVSMLPTTPAALTVQGTILGTFQYMSPEQIEGQEADSRSDIWAFGCVLYEMLTGRRAFDAKSRATLIAAIVDREPTPASTVQQSVPPALDRVIATCLAKDPADRFQTVHDLLLQLRWILEGGSAVPRLAVAARARPREQLAWAVSGILAAALLAAGSVALVHLRETSVPAEPVQFAVTPPDKTTLTTRQMALSPDGRSLALIVTAAGENVIFIRPLGSLVGQLLQGTEGASYPFWSPDSRWVGFFANGKLKKIQAGGGAPIVLCDAPSGRGGAWGRGNVIVFAPAAQQPLMKVVAAGGEVTPATTLEGNDGGHRWPFFLPDGDHFTFASGASGASRGRLKMGSLTSSAAVSLIAVDATVGYSAGHLLFVRGRTLMAQPFDAVRLRSTADAFPVFENIQVDTVLYAAVTGTAGGVLAYSQGSTAPRTALTWMDRGGKPLGVVLQPDVYNNLSLSPDDRRLAVAIDTGVPANRDVWVIDLDRSTASRLTFDPASDGIGSWSPDATRVAINSNRRGAYDLYLQSSTQPGTEELLLESKSSKYSPSFSPDGRYLVYSATGGTATGFDLWVLPLTGDRKPVPFLTTPAAEDNPEFSPDGHWIAYSSNAANREDVYVRPFPGPGGQYQISRNGGTQPRWRADGRELFFLALDGTLMATDVASGSTDFRAGLPQALFPTGVALTTNANRHQYAVTKDARRFLVNVPDRVSVAAPITVVLNWPAAVKP